MRVVWGWRVAVRVVWYPTTHVGTPIEGGPVATRLGRRSQGGL
jgi:hypothetical protein